MRNPFETPTGVDQSTYAITAAKQCVVFDQMVGQHMRIMLANPIVREYISVNRISGKIPGLNVTNSQLKMVPTASITSPRSVGVLGYGHYVSSHVGWPFVFAPSWAIEGGVVKSVRDVNFTQKQLEKVPADSEIRVMVPGQVAALTNKLTKMRELLIDSNAPDLSDFPLHVMMAKAARGVHPEDTAFAELVFKVIKKVEQLHKSLLGQIDWHLVRSSIATADWGASPWSALPDSTRGMIQSFAKTTPITSLQRTKHLALIDHALDVANKRSTQAAQLIKDKGISDDKIGGRFQNPCVSNSPVYSGPIAGYINNLSSPMRTMYMRINMALRSVGRPELDTIHVARQGDSKQTIAFIATTTDGLIWHKGGYGPGAFNRLYSTSAQKAPFNANSFKPFQLKL